MDINTIYAKYANCSCKKEHRCAVEAVKIGHGAINELTLLCGNYNHILLISDENTYEVCGRDVHQLLNEKISENLILSANGDVVIPNEEKISEIEAKLNDSTDLIIGVGSGVINDLCKYVSFSHSLPYYITATAPSMDGYASVGAALILEGMKVTLNAMPPKAIIADTAVLKNAPMEMLRAGYGDIIGKYSCLNDWKLSALINDEYFCPEIYDMTLSATDRVKELASGIVNRDEETVGVLMEALVTVGIAMSFVDCSRPASGSEHHLSHFFEITGILNKTKYFPHGIDVAFSAVVTAQLREQLIHKNPQNIPFNRKEWENEIKRIYLSSADGVIALQNKLSWYENDDSDNIKEKWNKIKEILQEAPSSDEMLAMLDKIGLCFDDFEKLYTKSKINDAILYAKDLKDRYSVLWLNYRYFR